VPKVSVSSCSTQANPRNSRSTPSQYPWWYRYWVTSRPPECASRTSTRETTCAGNGSVVAHRVAESAWSRRYSAVDGE
jgi:hypothetical protein